MNEVLRAYRKQNSRREFLAAQNDRKRREELVAEIMALKDAQEDTVDKMKPAMEELRGAIQQRVMPKSAL